MTGPFNDSAQVISGAMHYFRVPRGHWEDRLRRILAMGCDTVETYVPWNYHQPFAHSAPSFDGEKDLGGFLDLAASVGLDIIVRPGPYICAEWDFGGMPSWLLADPAQPAILRTSDPRYLQHVDQWLDDVVPIIAARQPSRGGRVIAVQVENEYGSFGNDAAYLSHVRHGLTERGIDVPLFTSDGATELHLAGGTVPGCLATVNFGSRPAESFAALDAFRPGEPTMVMEFWNGWFDHWGTAHHTREPDDAAAVLTDMLDAGHSVNFYMAHGGTSFGVWAGANSFPTETGQDYSPTVTSYDYDCPIGEDGRVGAKFEAFREAIGARTGKVPPPLPPTPARADAGRYPIAGATALSSVLDGIEPRVEAAPASFEALGVHHGVVGYTTTLNWGSDEQDLHLPRLADLAEVHLDGELLGRVHRAGMQAGQHGYVGSPLRLPADRPGEHELQITVRSLGRVNFGPFLADSKGLGPVLCGFQQVFGWEHAALDLTDLTDVPWDGASASPSSGDDGRGTGDGECDGVLAGPGLYRVPIDVDAPADAFLDMRDWQEGYVFLNGINLGRYWTAAGPQQTLYAPGPWWRAGSNEIVVVEFGTPGPHLEIVAEPILG